MPYESKIRPHNADRVTKNTTVSLSLLQNIKEIASRQQIPYNELLTEGINYVLETFKKPQDYKKTGTPKDRVQMATTFSNDQYELLKDRARKLRTHANTLIELGMQYIIEKYQKE